jgi:predicted small secreted protein
MNRLIFVVVAAMAALPLSGCNTVRGVGQDIEKGGEWIQRSTR